MKMNVPMLPLSQPNAVGLILAHGKTNRNTPRPKFNKILCSFFGTNNKSFAKGASNCTANQTVSLCAGAVCLLLHEVYMNLEENSLCKLPLGLKNKHLSRLELRCHHNEEG